MRGLGQNEAGRHDGIDAARGEPTVLTVYAAADGP